LKKTKTTTTISAKVFITGANCPLLRNRKRKPENKTERERERGKEKRQREKRGREHHPLSFLFLFFFFDVGRVSKEYNKSWGKRKG
jgi:hypothetical protein